MSDVYAGKTRPIRCSKLASIPKCGARVYMLEVINNDDDTAGPSAHTGSLTHEGVAAFHKERGTLKTRKDAAWQAIADTAKKFPLAEANEVRLFLTPYMDDPRNIEAKLLAVEMQVEFTLEPHPIDSTGELIYVQGTLDQIREVNGVPRIYDLKTGKKTGWEMLHDYAIQIAAYTHGARQCGFPKTEPGSIIRNYAYRVRGCALPSPDGVFWALPFKIEAVPLLLENVRLHVGLQRNGEIQFNPGPHCTYCEFGGLAGCVSKWNELLQLGRM